MRRSDFLRSGGMFVACACGASLINGCQAITGNSDTPVLSENNYRIDAGILILDLEKIPEMKQDGGSVKIDMKEPDHKLIIARVGEDEYVALRNRCSHGGRELDYLPVGSIFRCVCFGHSRFDAEGKVTKGLAKNMLKNYNTILEENELLILIS